jgi:glycine cleavage system H lipoate-binding protein
LEHKELVVTVIIVLLTLFGFVLADCLLQRKKAPQSASEPSEVAVTAPSPPDGFLLPQDFRYHPGHTWALHERIRRVRVGVDEFAAALMGRIERVELPEAGVWIRQGQKILAFYRNGEKTEMLSPTEGEVIEVNPDVLQDPSLIRKDPYGRGWILLVDAPDEETVARNLIPEGLVQLWMRAAVDRLFALQRPVR